MGNIPRDSWNIIERIIRRYPDVREEYTAMLADTIGIRGVQQDGQPRGNGIGNPTEAGAFALQSAKLERMRREIVAVERAYNELTEPHKKVIRIRFWSDRFRNVPYKRMKRAVSYEEAQMKRIIGGYVKKVGIYLGEI